MSSTNKLFLLIIATFSSILFISPSYAATTTNPYTTFIKTACSTTTYPSLCHKTCLPYSSKIAGDSKKLLISAISSTLTIANSGNLAVIKVSKRKGLSKYEANVVRDSMEEMRDIIDELEKSMAEINRFGEVKNESERKFRLDNVKMWLSGSITDENTCMDELDEGNVSALVKDRIGKSVLGVTKMSQNALSLCNRL